MNTYKKYVAATTFAVVAVISVGVAEPARAAALSTAQIQAVLSLLQAFGVDSATMTNVEAALGGATADTSAVSSTALSSAILGLFRLGDEGDGVTLLQLLLAADPTVYPEGVVSGYFGPLTQKALRQYQKKHGLEQVGFVGPRTLKALKDELDDNQVAIEDDDSDEDGDDSQNRGRGRGHRFCAIVPPGHLIAPGWLRKNNNAAPVIPICQKLPPGIAKRIGTGSSAGTTTPDTTAPVITGINVDSIEAASAEVEWKTNENATSVVDFGTTDSYGMSASKGTTRDTSHSVALTSLSAGTLYHYRVTSVDASGNTATSSDQTFTTSTVATPDTTAPTISDIGTDSITSTSAEVRWKTSEDTTGKVYYGTAMPLDLSTALSMSSALDDSHDVDLTGLTASTTYRYLITATDASGNTATSSEASFTTSS